MRYAEHPLPPELHGLVAAVWTLDLDGAPGECSEQDATPDGCIELIRRRAGRSHWRRDQPEVFAAGLNDGLAPLRFSGDAAFTAIKLWPWAWHALGGPPCPGFHDDWIALPAVSPLAALADPDPRIAIERLVQAFAAVAPSPLGRATLAAASPGDLAARLALPPRQLQRIFARAFGVSPRAYLRRLRFAATLREVQHQADPLADMAAAQGYADQAHMARDFRDFAGMPPSAARTRAKGPFV